MAAAFPCAQEIGAILQCFKGQRASFCPTLRDYLRPTAFFGHERGAVPKPGVPFSSPCACESRGGAYVPVCSVDMYASRQISGAPVHAQGSRASMRRISPCQRERQYYTAPATVRKNQLMVTTATRLTPLSAMTRPLPSLVGIMLRTTPPPDGIGNVWNFSRLRVETDQSVRLGIAFNIPDHVVQGRDPVGLRTSVRPAKAIPWSRRSSCRKARDSRGNNRKSRSGPANQWRCGADACPDWAA